MLQVAHVSCYTTHHTFSSIVENVNRWQHNYTNSQHSQLKYLIFGKNNTNETQYRAEMEQDETQQRLILNVQVTLKLGFQFTQRVDLHIYYSGVAVSLLSQGVGLLPRFRKLFLGPYGSVSIFYDMYHVSCFDVVAVVIVVVFCQAG